MKKPDRPSLVSYFLLFLPPFFWSTNFIVGKALVDKVPPWTLNTGRFIVSTLVLMPVLLYRKEWPPRHVLLPLVLMSLTGVFAFNAVLYIRLRYTSAVNGALVNSTTPVTTACIAWLLIGEKITRRRVVGMLLSFVGVGWIVSQGSLDSLLHLRLNPGDIIVFFATSLWGFYTVMAKRMMQYLSPVVLTSLTTCIGTLLLLPVAALELRTHAADLYHRDALLAFLYLGIFPSLLAFVLWNRSISTFGPGRASLVYNTLPLFAVILSQVFLHEALGSYQIVGGILIVVGVLIGTRG